MPSEYYPWFSESPELLQRLLRWLRDAENSTPETLYRERSMESYRFYAGDQDSLEAKATLTALKRPATTYNEIKPKIDMLVGMAAQTKHDILLEPVGLEDESLAEIMTGTVKHYRRKLKISRKELECFEHTTKGGRALLYFYIDKANPYQPKICARRLPGYQFYIDPQSTEYDLSDARYMFIDKWLTEEEITTFWPDYNITAAQTGSRYYDMPAFWNEARDLYRVVEAWYTTYEEVVWFINPMTQQPESLNPDKFKELQKALAKGVQLPQNPATGTPSQTLQMNLEGTKSFAKVYKYAILSNSLLLEEGRSPYKFEMYPGVLFGAYKDEDNNCWFSAVEMMKDPQKALNTMRRQLSHLLQTLPKGILAHEVGAILNIEEYETRSSEPNFHLEIAGGKMEAFKFIQQPQISPIYQQLDVVYSQSMKDASGVQNELMGVQTTSREPGVSVRARQETNLAVLYLLYDNLRESRHNAAWILTGLIQQYMTQAQLIRIEGESGKQLVQINSQSNRQMPGFNDVTALDFDLAIQDTTETATTRLSVAQILTEYSQNNPGAIPPDLILEYADMPYATKMRVKQTYEQQQQTQQQQADREFQLKMKELEIKEISAQAQMITALAKQKEVTQADYQHANEMMVKQKEIKIKEKQAAKAVAKPQLRAVK
jgi:hypothetical protein